MSRSMIKPLNSGITTNHNIPQLQALKVKKFDNILQVQQQSLILNALLNTSKAKPFYLFSREKYIV